MLFITVRFLFERDRRTFLQLFPTKFCVMCLLFLVRSSCKLVNKNIVTHLILDLSSNHVSNFNELCKTLSLHCDFFTKSFRSLRGGLGRRLPGTVLSIRDGTVELLRSTGRLQICRRWRLGCHRNCHRE